MVPRGVAMVVMRRRPPPPGAQPLVAASNAQQGLARRSLQRVMTCRRPAASLSAPVAPLLLEVTTRVVAAASAVRLVYRRVIITVLRVG